MMEAVEQLRDAALKAVPGAQIESTGAGSVEPGLLIDRAHIYAVAKFFKEDERYQMDYCSCVTGVDYLPKQIKKKVKQTDPNDSNKTVDKEVVEDVPGCIEVVYHLYSIAKRHGPLKLKVRAPREAAQCRVPSLTPLWRGCEFQEREAFDLYGVTFEGHPDLRRILMWDEFKDFPMRKDYQPPLDYEWEPTPHDETLERAKQVHGTVPPTAVADEKK
jgi:NADH-quinone oxidoreductase subunit C